jgi:dephospho-CoA kinase
MQDTGVYLIGLTGGIACGKSSVLAMLAELGAWTLDADQVTHHLQEPGQPVYQQIVDTFGPDILIYPDGPINRRKLGERVFNNPDELQKLETLVHPAVRAEVFAWTAHIEQQAQQGQVIPETSPAHKTRHLARPVAVLDAIKLLEGGWKEHCQSIWVVVCSEQQQISRLMETRGLSESAAQLRLAAQPPQESRISHADVIIDNSGSLLQTRRQVESAWQRMLTSL